jgi:ectoine hydroxylase-related dioxygenase (phytanoyl-CoA dioxygenase family)
VVEARRQVRPPIQPSCEKGDIMLRDLRTWHAGMPNESEDYRIMLALGYQVSHSAPLGFAYNSVHSFPLED